MRLSDVNEIKIYKIRGILKFFKQSSVLIVKYGYLLIDYWKFQDSIQIIYGVVDKYVKWIRANHICYNSVVCYNVTTVFN